MTSPVDVPGAFDRRTALVAALTVGGVVAFSPGCASQRAEPLQRFVGPVRAFLNAIRQGRLPDYLNELGSPRPIISGLEDAHGVSLLTRLRGVPLTLAEGSYLIHPDALRVDVLLSDARDATGGLIGVARFTFVAASDGNHLVAASFGPTDEALSVARVVEPGSSTERVQQIYDALAVGGGGTLYFTAGTHHVALVLSSRTVRVAGAGMGATILKPVAADRPVLEAGYNSGSWSVVEISDLSITGDGTGIGFQAGHTPRRPLDEFAGRTLFRGVRFENLHICISRPYGQIGLWLQNCVFASADYHLYSIGTVAPGEPMHAGNLVARDCHFSGASKAVFFMKSATIGTGQITFDHCIMELNPGYVFYADTLNGVDGVPGMLVRSCWNEQNATAASVVIDRTERPVYAFFKDTGLIRFEDTPLGNLRLVNATVVTHDCALDLLKLVTSDRMSTLTHHDARGFGTFVPKGVATSIAAVYQVGPNRALSFAMPLRDWRKAGSTNGQVVLSHRGGRFSSTDGASSSSVANGGGSSTYEVVHIPAGKHVQLLPRGDAPGGCWIAWIVDCRLVSGLPVTLTITGSSGVSYGFPIDHPTLRSVSGMAWCDASIKGLHIELAGADAGVSTMEIGVFEVMAFLRRQDALAYLNSTVEAMS